MNSADRDILTKTAALPQLIEPERDLWPGIEAALGDRNHPRPGDSDTDSAGSGAWLGKPKSYARWVVPLTLAACMTLAAMVGFWTGVGASRPGPIAQPISPDLPAVVELPEQPELAELAEIPELEELPELAELPGTTPVRLTIDADLYRTRTLLAAEIEAELLRLPEDARNVVNENLAAIHQALDEIDAVLGQAPHTDLDQQLLMSMYADQLSLLSSMHSVVRTSSTEILL